MEDKGFKTIDEQLEILKSRGLKIPDEVQAKDFLLRNNYYRVSGYSLTLRQHDVFFPQATFSNIVEIYLFDYELRHLLLQYIEMIEVQFKSIYTYEFTKLYGGTGYLNGALFTQVGRHTEIMLKAGEQKQRRLQHEAYLKHFVKERKQEIPLWAFVDLLTIADISILYSITQPTIQVAIADDFGMDWKSAPQILAHFMHSITIIRNLCAHGSRLYNRLFEQKPSLNKQEQDLLIRDANSMIDNAHLYGFILVMRRLLPNRDFDNIRNGLVLLTRKYPFVDMRHYGFRSDWQCSL